MTDRQAFRSVVESLCAAFGRNPSDAIATAYWLACQDLDDREFSRAVSAAMTGDKAWPTPARIRELAGKLQAEPSPDRLGLEAWRAVREAMGRVGRYRSVDFGPVVNTVIDSLGGWQALCEQPEEDSERFLRPQFVKAVAAYRSTVPANAPKYLPGITEVANQNAIGVERALPESVMRIGIDGLHDAPLLPAVQLPGPEVKQLAGPVEGAELQALSRDEAIAALRRIRERCPKPGRQAGPATADAPVDTRDVATSGQVPDENPAEFDDTPGNGPGLTQERRSPRIHAIAYPEGDSHAGGQP